MTLWWIGIVLFVVVVIPVVLVLLAAPRQSGQADRNPRREDR